MSNKESNKESDNESNAESNSEFNNAFTHGIAYPSPFDRYAVALCESASRHICIQSPKLDYAVFDNRKLVDVISALARRSRQAQVRILINDARPLSGRGHQLLQLARRLPSVVQIRKLAEHPQWNNETIVIRDRDGVLYKPGDSDHDALFEPQARASTVLHLELFEELWRYSVEEPELRSLHI